MTIWKNSSLGFTILFHQNSNLSGFDLPKKVYNLLKNKKYNNGLEYCSGFGAIGLNLLHKGICKKINFSDIDHLSLEDIKNTVKLNKWNDRIGIYRSSSFDQIPVKTFDLIFCNMPWSNNFKEGPIDESDKRKLFDINWKIHKSFYKNLKKYIDSKSDVFVLEDYRFSDVKLWENMIKNEDIYIEDYFKFPFITDRKHGGKKLLKDAYIMKITKK